MVPFLLVGGESAAGCLAPWYFGRQPAAGGPMTGLSGVFSVEGNPVFDAPDSELCWKVFCGARASISRACVSATEVVEQENITAKQCVRVALRKKADVVFAKKKKMSNLLKRNFVARSHRCLARGKTQ